jgi:phosphoesterase RecJ-like protein
VATALLAAIVADTGRFQYSSTTPEVLRIGAELVEAGAVPEVVGQNLFEKVPFAYLSLLSTVAARAELDESKSLVSAVVLLADLESTQVGFEETDGLIDEIRIAREAEVALLIKEVDSGFKASLRSRGAVDVSAIAGDFGGGGHHNASGFSHEGPPEDIVEAVRSRLDG